MYALVAKNGVDTAENADASTYRPPLGHEFRSANVATRAAKKHFELTWVPTRRLVAVPVCPLCETTTGLHGAGLPAADNEANREGLDSKTECTLE